MFETICYIGLYEASQMWGSSDPNWENPPGFNNPVYDILILINIGSVIIKKSICCGFRMPRILYGKFSNLIYKMQKLFKRK